MSMNVLMKQLVISRHRASIKMVESNLNTSMSSTKRKMVHVLTSMSAKVKKCGPRADCVGLSGSFECHLTGLGRNIKKCEGIKECTTRRHNCAKNAICINAFKSFCHECNDGCKICDEVDQCITGIHNCHPIQMRVIYLL